MSKKEQYQLCCQDLALYQEAEYIIKSCKDICDNRVSCSQPEHAVWWTQNFDLYNPYILANYYKNQDYKETVNFLCKTAKNWHLHIKKMVILYPIQECIIFLQRELKELTK